ncbi:hypothetical protein ACFL54_07695 [Planctomycetota bacterium]
MHDTLARQGLCSTCNNAVSCIYLRERGHHALVCETFDSYSPRELPQAVTSFTPPNGTIETPFGSSEETVMPGGLCRNCGNQTFCSFPKPDSGVWQCEEYS